MINSAKAIVFATKQVAVAIEQVLVAANAMINATKHIGFAIEPMCSVLKI
jgi:hypothetical protein